MTYREAFVWAVTHLFRWPPLHPRDAPRYRACPKHWRGWL